MTRKFISTIAVILLLGMVTFADEIAEMFDFEALTQEALTDSIKIDSAELNVESKELALEEIVEDAETFNYPGGDRVSYIKRMTGVLADPILAIADLEVTKIALEKEPVTIEADIHKKGMNYLLLQDEVALNETLLNFKNTYMDNTKKKFESGVSTSTDYTNAVLEAQSQELKLVELKASLEAVAIEINHLLGHKLDAPLNIEEIITASPYEIFVIDSEYTNRVMSYPAVITKTAALEAKSIVFDLNVEKYVEVDKEYKIALSNKKIAEIELLEAQKSFNVSLRSAYNKYLSTYDTYTLSLKQNELALKIYDEAVLKHNLGLISQEELLKAEESKLNSNFAITKAIYNYNVAKIDFKNLY